MRKSLRSFGEAYASLQQISLLAVVIAAAGTVAYAAHGGMENDATAIVKAKIPLAQAVTTAEQHVNGKAARAEYENSKHG